MTAQKRVFNRREWLRRVSASTAALGWTRALARGADSAWKRKTILAFYCDDTSPYIAGADAFKTFLDYCAEQAIAGESTCLLGARGYSISRKPTPQEQAFLEQVKRAWKCGIDTHMELMTHRGLFDFQANREPEGVAHEGLWLHEPAITVEQYAQYLGNVIAEGEKAGIQFTGLTWPGCGCSACERRYAELRKSGSTKPNPALWQALLQLAKQGKFRGRTVPCFFDSSETDYSNHCMAGDGPFAVYNLKPNAGDHFGIWENNPARVDPDYYISADGKSGIIVRRVQAGAPYCIWYSHWQGLNPAKGVGWRAFTTVVERIHQHLREQVVWMRPSEVSSHYRDAGGWQFLDKL